MIKKLYLFLLMVVISVTSFAADFEVDGICYNIISIPDLTCEVCVNPDGYSGSVVIPSTVEFNQREFKVIAIGKNAFRFSGSLNSVDLPTTIKIIKELSFNNTGLTSIQFPESLKIIESSAFSACLNLEEIDLPNSIIEIGSQAFANCQKLKSIRLPQSLTIIAAGTFSNCSRKKSVFFLLEEEYSSIFINFAP